MFMYLRNRTPKCAIGRHNQCEINQRIDICFCALHANVNMGK